MSKTETLHMKIGPLLGEQLLEIAQTEISKGNVDFGLSRYTLGLCGFTNEHALMCLKNKAVLVTDESGTCVNLVDDEETRNKNAHNIFDWESIIKERYNNIKGLIKNLNICDTEFHKYYNGNIRNYSMTELMKRYYEDEKILRVMTGTSNIAARICGNEDCYICDKGAGNPYNAWKKVEGRIESYLVDKENEDISYSIIPPAKWEIVLYLTVKYNKLIRLLHKEYLKFENTFRFLIENDFIKKPLYIEEDIEKALNILIAFTNTNGGYDHPLCNEGLNNYKNKLWDDIKNTYYGNEYITNGLICKDIMDGYDAGWLSPNGEFYGANGATSNMIHMNLAEDIFKGNNEYAKQMILDDVSVSGINSPDYWLEKHGWIKIHHDDCYGAFIGHRNEEPTPDYPYAYVPTAIQVKMICDYADKFYGGKFYTEANVMGRDFHPDPYKTYAVRQMDDIMLHEIFKR